jgi:hypothetical protein
MRGILLALICAVVAGCATVQDVGERADEGDPDAGLLTLESGRTLEIRYDALRITGHARFEWPDGRTYEGDFVAGRPHGIGIETLADGSRYAGTFVDGRRDGQGELTLADGAQYVGEFSRGRREGRGTFTSPAGRYEGSWVNDVPQGQGRFVYADGSSYRGAWLNGRRSGFGKFDRGNGLSIYEGDWQNDLPHGFGVMRDGEGFEYSGSFVAGQRSGYGALGFGEGIGYEGMWHENRRHGYGRETRPDGSVYEGEWLDDRHHGTGVMRRVDGSFHEGTYENGRPLGPGTRRYEEGTEITGLWNGNSVSSGVVNLPDGGEFAGALYKTSKRTVVPAFLEWLEAEANAGSAQAALLLGDAHRLFESPPRDLGGAARWYEMAAARGSAEGAFRLAEVIAATDGPNERMIGYLEAAAERGHAGAHSRLGSFRQLGNHLPKDHARARFHFEAAMRAGDLMARNNLAWLLATSPVDPVRDGALAVRLARPMALIYDHWTYIDTLAAAYAEAGEFAAARAAERRAIALATGDAPPETIEALESRLASFEADTPYREP